MRIVVTGGLGAVGAPLTAELRRRGHDVWVIDLQHHEGPQYIRADVGEHRQLEAAIKRAKPELVYHAAAEFGRWNGEDFYETMWKSNAVGTKHVLNLAKAHGYRSVIFSSSEVYGDYEESMDEDVLMRIPIRQMNDYAISKWVNELQVLNHTAMHGTETVRVRLFNTFGPGEHYSEYRSVICRFAYYALTKQPLTVFKGHRRTSTYVTDCVNALSAIATNFKPGEIYNIASEELHTIEDAAKLVIEAAGADMSLVHYKDSEPFTTKDKVVNAAKAKRDLGMATTVKLPEGIQHTIAWMRKTYGL